MSRQDNQDQKDHQDWTPVTFKRSFKAKEPKEPKEPKKLSEALDMSYLPKKCVASESLQSLIRKRIEMSLSQEKADALCSFPVHTFKKIESKQLIPTQHIQNIIQKKLSIQIVIEKQ